MSSLNPPNFAMNSSKFSTTVGTKYISNQTRLRRMVLLVGRKARIFEGIAQEVLANAALKESSLQVFYRQAVNGPKCSTTMVFYGRRQHHYSRTFHNQHLPPPELIQQCSISQLCLGKESVTPVPSIPSKSHPSGWLFLCQNLPRWLVKGLPASDSRPAPASHPQEVVS